MGIDPGRFKATKGIDRSTWADWLADAEPPAAIKQEVRAKRVEQANTYVPRQRHVNDIAPKPVQKQPVHPPAVTPAVSIQISLPALHRPQFKKLKLHYKRARRELLKRFTKQQLAIAVGVIVLLFLSWFSLHLSKVHNDHKTALAAQKAAAAASGTDVASNKPTFTPVVPSGKEKLATPNGTSSRFDATKGTYSYNDSIGNLNFTVSQQQLPPGQSIMLAVSQAAKSLGANTSFTTGWGTAYIMTSQKYNSQQLVFTVKDLLIFIQSGNILGNGQWITYINSLD